MTKQEARNALDVARHAIVMKFPFIGEISLRMDLVPTDDSKNPTTTSDGSKVFIDLEFMSKLRKEELSFVVAHEVWHNVLLHPARKQTRDQRLFDLASDMEVNWLIKTNNNDRIFSLPFDAPLPPSHLKGSSAEQIYDWLVQNCQQEKDETRDGIGQEDQESQESQDASQPKESIGKETGNNAKDSSSKENLDPKNRSQGTTQSSKPRLECKDNKEVTRALNFEPKKTKSIDGQFDIHRYIDGSEHIDDGKGKDDVDFKPKMSKSFCEEMREIAISQLQKCALSQGTLPIGIESFVKKLEKPEIPWQDHLAQFVSQLHVGKLEWTPPSRRHLYQDLYLQSHRTKKISIALGIDTSGSCIALLPKFFAEMESLMKSFDSYVVHRIDCDASVENHIVYDSESNPFTANAQTGIDWRGGGGTSFTPVLDYIEENRLDIDALVYISDGYGTVREKAPQYPVLWILPKDGYKDFCNWGKKVTMHNAKCGWF